MEKARLSEILDSFDLLSWNWDEVEHALNDTTADFTASTQIGSMVRFLARLGDDDAFGLGWSIMHKIETVKGYESILLKNWTGSQWTTLMINRILNKGIYEIDGINIRPLGIAPKSTQ